jgi:hypothetical protein
MDIINLILNKRIFFWGNDPSATDFRRGTIARHIRLHGGRAPLPRKSLEPLVLGVTGLLATHPNTASRMND